MCQISFSVFLQYVLFCYEFVYIFMYISCFHGFYPIYKLFIRYQKAFLQSFYLWFFLISYQARLIK